MDSHNGSTGLMPGESRSLSWISFSSQSRGARLHQRRTSFSMRPPFNDAFNGAAIVMDLFKWLARVEVSVVGEARDCYLIVTGNVETKFA